jgi:hypothetical protein
VRSESGCRGRGTGPVPRQEMPNLDDISLRMVGTMLLRHQEVCSLHALGGTRHRAAGCERGGCLYAGLGTMVRRLRGPPNLAV